MVNTIKNSKLNVQLVTLLTTPIVGLMRIDVTFANTDNVFVGKTIDLETDKGVKLKGVVGRNSNTWFIDLSIGLTNATNYTANTSSKYYETFTNDLSEDNAHVTFSDIHKNIVSTESKVEFGSLVEFGKDGLLTGSEKYLINNLTQKQVSLVGREKINNINVTPTVLCNVVVPKTRLYEHIFVISGDDLFIKVAVQVSTLGVLANREYSIRVLEFSSSAELKNQKLNLAISNNEVGDVNYLNIVAVFDNNKIGGVITSKDYYVTHITNNNVIFYDVEPIGATKHKLNYNLGLLYSSAFSELFPIDSNVESFDTNGVVYKKINRIKILDFSDLNSIVTEGDYYLHNGDIGSILNKPINNNQRFDLTVRNMNLDSVLDEIFIIQTYTCFVNVPNTVDYKLQSYVRICSTGAVGATFTSWLVNSFGDHTHTASTITQDELNRFVTDQNILNWNKVYSDFVSEKNTWKLSVDTIADLATKYPIPKKGWCVLVKEDNNIYKYDGINWVSDKQVVDINYDGIVTSEQYQEFFVSGSQSKYIEGINNTDVWINRKTINEKTIYGENYEFLFRYNIDLIKRTEPLTEPLGSYSYQQGFDVLMTGDDNFGIGRDIVSSKLNRNYGYGTGLRFNTANQTIIGSYNEIINHAFIIGNGSDNLNRSNLFTISIGGLVEVAGGYAIKNKTNEEILLADGSTLRIDAISGKKIEIVWDATIDPLPLQTFEIFYDVGVDAVLNENTLVFVNGILLYSNQYTITDQYLLTILDVLDNGDIITIK